MAKWRKRLGDPLEPLKPAQTILPATERSNQQYLARLSGGTNQPSTIPITTPNFSMSDSTQTGGGVDLASTGGTGGGSRGGTAMPGGYVPALYNQAFWDDRDALAQDILSGMGIDNAQLTGILGPTAGAVNYLASFLGGDQPGELLGPGGQAGEVSSIMNQLLTPGGEALDPGAIMSALANADPNSAMGMLMSQMSPEEVGNMAMYLLSAAGGNPLQQQGMQAMFDQGKRDYNVGLARGTETMDRPYWQGLASGPFSQFFG